jgi:hypothetical protein
MEDYVLIKEKDVFEKYNTLRSKIECILEGLIYNSDLNMACKLMDTFEIHCFHENTNKNFIKNLYDLLITVELNDLDVLSDKSNNDDDEDEDDEIHYRNENFTKMEISKWLEILYILIKELNEIIENNDNLIQL